MLKKVVIHNFKSFKNSTVYMSPFTLLVGANAGGKSNIREVLRFFHGVSRGYTLAEIVGEKWEDGGVRVWTGLRGGAPNVIRHGESQFSLQAEFDAESQRHRSQKFQYRIDIEYSNRTLRVLREHLLQNGKYVFDTHPDGDARGSASRTIKARIRKLGGSGGHPPDDSFLDDRPILGQIGHSAIATEATRRVAGEASDLLESMAFLDLSPHAAREAGPVGIRVLGDRGENLSSVLHLICEIPEARNRMISWVRALTPLDAVDLQFNFDLNGRVMAELIESSGATIPLSAASDGTVRFLAMIAVMMNPDRPKVIFFEELENGIHPNRVYLLLDLIGQSVSSAGTQIVATSHSPQLLVHAYRTRNANPELVYRSIDGSSVVIDVKRAREMSQVLADSDPAALMAAGWFENVASYLSEEGPE